MKDVELTVILVLSKKYFVPEITAQDFPIGVNGSLEYSLNRLNEYMTRAVLLITDNTNLVRAFVNRKLVNSYVVYIGDPLDTGAAFDLVTDVWSPFDGGVLLKKRYLLLLDYIRCRAGQQKFTGSIQNHQS